MERTPSGNSSEHRDDFALLIYARTAERSMKVSIRHGSPDIAGDYGARAGRAGAARGASARGLSVIEGAHDCAGRSQCCRSERLREK